MATDDRGLIPERIMPAPGSRYAGSTCTIAIVVTALALLAACGGDTIARPTANDTATIAAANIPSVVATSPGAGTAAAPASGTRGFGGLLTPVRAAASAGIGGTGTRSSTVARSTGRASSVATGSAAVSTLGANASAPSPALDACALLTDTDVSSAMGESFTQVLYLGESPLGMASALVGYSSASCVFAATASTANALKAVQVGTLRRTPATNPPTGSGAFATIDDVWRFVTQQAQGSAGNPGVVTGVGDEAFAVDDTTNPGDVDVYVRKGNVLLLVTVTGYAMGGRDRAAAVATQAAGKL